METRLFEEGTVPEYTTADWYIDREVAPHVEEGAHRGRLEIAARFINDSGVASVVDLGAGDGGLLTLLDGEIRGWGYDLAPNNVAGAAARGVDVRYGDVVLGFDAITWGDLAVMTEMLEHLVDPHGFLRSVGEHVDRVVVSSPFTETAEEHYGFHTWAWDIAGYVELLDQAGFESVRCETWSMFQVHYGVKK